MGRHKVYKTEEDVRKMKKEINKKYYEKKLKESVKVNPENQQKKEKEVKKCLDNLHVIPFHSLFEIYADTKFTAIIENIKNNSTSSQLNNNLNSFSISLEFMQKSSKNFYEFCFTYLQLYDLLKLHNFIFYLPYIKNLFSSYDLFNNTINSKIISEIFNINTENFLSFKKLFINFFSSIGRYEKTLVNNYLKNSTISQIKILQYKDSDGFVFSLPLSKEYNNIYNQCFKEICNYYNISSSKQLNFEITPSLKDKVYLNTIKYFISSCYLSQKNFKLTSSSDFMKIQDICLMDSIRIVDGVSFENFQPQCNFEVYSQQYLKSFDIFQDQQLLSQLNTHLDQSFIWRNIQTIIKRHLKSEPNSIHKTIKKRLSLRCFTVFLTCLLIIPKEDESALKKYSIKSFYSNKKKIESLITQVQSLSEISKCADICYQIISEFSKTINFLFDSVVTPKKTSFSFPLDNTLKSEIIDLLQQVTIILFHKVEILK